MEGDVAVLTRTARNTFLCCF